MRHPSVSLLGMTWGVLVNLFDGSNAAQQSHYMTAIDMSWRTTNNTSHELLAWVTQHHVLCRRYVQLPASIMLCDRHPIWWSLVREFPFRRSSTDGFLNPGPCRSVSLLCYIISFYQYHSLESWTSRYYMFASSRIISIICEIIPFSTSTCGKIPAGPWSCFTYYVIVASFYVCLPRAFSLLPASAMYLRRDRFVFRYCIQVLDDARFSTTKCRI